MIEMTWRFSIFEGNERCFPRLNGVETIRRISSSQCSVARFGDGEAALAFLGRSLAFQRWEPKLAAELRQALSDPADDVLNCFNHIFVQKKEIPWIVEFERSKKPYARFDSILSDNDIGVHVRRRQHISHRAYWWIIRRLARPQEFGEASAFFVGLYVDLYKEGRLAALVEELLQVFRGRTVLLVCPRNPLFGPSFFDLEDDIIRLGARSIEFIEVPEIDAFSIADGIMEEIAKRRGFDLIALQAGPTATILSHRIRRYFGVRALDIGSFNVQIKYLLQLSQQHANA